MPAKISFWIASLFSRLFLIFFLLTSGVGLMPDEAQYWTWSLFPQLGYYSKPPGIAWQIFLGTHAFGMNELGVKIVSILLPIPIALLIKNIVLLLTGNGRVAYLTALAFILSPLGWSASLLATTDGGMLLFGVGAIYCYLKNQSAEAFAKLAIAICEVPAKGRASIPTKPIVVTMGEERSRLTASRHEQSAVASFAKASTIQCGGCIALGALWKWMTYALLLPITLYEIVIKQWNLVSFLKMCALALLGILPALYWNVHHDFATFRHVGGTILNTHTSGAGANPLAFFFAGVLLVSPGFFLLSLPALFSTKKEKALLLRLIVFVIFGGLLIASFFRKTQGNWAVLGQVFLFPLMGCYLVTAKRGWYLPAAIALSIATQAVFFAGPYFGGNLLVKNPLRHSMGLENIPHALAQAGYKEDDFLFSDRYQTVSQIWFYTQRKTYFFNMSNLRYNQFSFWPGMNEECLHKDGIYVTIISSAEKGSLHERVRHLRKLLLPYFVHVGKGRVHKLSLTNYLITIPVHDYSGKANNRVPKF